MKLIYAGQPPKPYTSLLFNCTRNQNCELPYFVPVKNYSDPIFFAYLPGYITSHVVEIIDVCDDLNKETIVFNKYVVGKTPSGSFYGVFGSPVITTFTAKKFYFKLVVTVGAVDYTYYSEAYEIPICDDLTNVYACYSNPPIGSDAYDINGVYYGFPTDLTPQGDVNYRYQHNGFVRNGSVIEQANKLSFTLFNSRRAYKNTTSREHLFSFELVPNFYKNFLLALFARGNIKIDGVDYTLSEEQQMSVLDTDHKLWRADIILQEQTKQQFDCGEQDCEAPPVQNDCQLLDLDFTTEQVEGIWYGQLTGNGSNWVQWEVYERDSLILIASGVGMTPDQLYFELPGIDPATVCYFIRYRIRCGIDPDFTYSPWSLEEYFGDCIGNPTYYNYECERYLCSYCAEPLDTIIAQSTNPALTLFKYYKSQSSPAITLRPIATSVAAAADTLLGPPKNTCFESCNFEILTD